MLFRALHFVSVKHSMSTNIEDELHKLPGHNRYYDGAGEYYE